MKKFEIQANFTGCLFKTIEAENEEEAKTILLTQMGTILNKNNDPCVTYENVVLPNSIIIDEINIDFPKVISPDLIAVWKDFDIEEEGDEDHDEIIKWWNGLEHSKQRELYKYVFDIDMDKCGVTYPELVNIYYKYHENL